LNFKIALFGFLFLDIFSLLFIGKTWFIFFLPLFFLLFVFLSRFAWISPFFFYLQHHILLLLFGAHSYLLYFIHLLALVLLFTRYHSFFTKLSFVYVAFMIGVLSLFFFLAEEFFFALYILYGSLEREYYMSVEVLIYLTIIHIFLFFLLFFKGSIFFKKD
jgi:hypothetical protein